MPVSQNENEKLLVEAHKIIKVLQAVEKIAELEPHWLADNYDRLTHKKQESLERLEIIITKIRP